MHHDYPDYSAKVKRWLEAPIRAGSPVTDEAFHAWLREEYPRATHPLNINDFQKHIAHWAQFVEHGAHQSDATAAAAPGAEMSGLGRLRARARVVHNRGTRCRNRWVYRRLALAPQPSASSILDGWGGKTHRSE